MKRTRRFRSKAARDLEFIAAFHEFHFISKQRKTRGTKVNCTCKPKAIFRPEKYLDVSLKSTGDFDLGLGLRMSHIGAWIVKVAERLPWTRRPKENGDERGVRRNDP